jgi:hypothetical protein
MPPNVKSDAYRHVGLSMISVKNRFDWVALEAEARSRRFNIRN